MPPTDCAGRSGDADIKHAPVPATTTGKPTDHEITIYGWSTSRLLDARVNDQPVRIGKLQQAPRWHARGQGFKSPQLHPRSEALFGFDRPRIARLGQQIGSNLLVRGQSGRPHAVDAGQHRRCRRPVDRAPTGAAATSPVVRDEGRIGRARQGRSRPAR
jgi:hypothetical protein